MVDKRRNHTIRGGHGRTPRQFLKEAPRNSAIFAAIVSVVAGTFFHDTVLSFVDLTELLPLLSSFPVFQEEVATFIVVFPVVFILWFVKIEMGL